MNKHAPFLLAAWTAFIAGGCLTATGQVTGGGGAGPSGVPFVSSAAPGDSPYSATGDTPSSDEKSDTGDSVGDPTVASRTLPDPSGGLDSPITIVGTPRGVSPKPGQHPAVCSDGSAFHLCFQGVSAIYMGPASEAGRFEYAITGTLLEKCDDGNVVSAPRESVDVMDLLFNTSVGNWVTGATSGYFQFHVISPVGRGVELTATECYHVTHVDLTIPELSASSITVDPCSSSEPTDVYTPPDPQHPPDCAQQGPPPSPVVTPPHTPPSDDPGTMDDMGGGLDDTWWGIHHRLK